MVQPKTDQEIAILREGGKIHAEILEQLGQAAVPGVRPDQLDRLARELCAKYSVEPAFLGYQPPGAPRPFPGAICLSVNEVIVHGMPTKQDTPLQEGDVVSLDLGLVYQGLITDAAITLGIGRITPAARHLLQVTEQALEAGLQAAQAGCRTGDIGAAIEELIRPHGYAVIRGLAGHGVGYSVHEDPFVPNTGRPGQGDDLPPGSVIAVEPMLALGSAEISASEDGFTITTADHSLSAHFEHTVALTDSGPEVLTRRV